jgi:hypothetical protein
MLVRKVNTWLFHTITRDVGSWNRCFISANSSFSYGSGEALGCFSGVYFPSTTVAMVGHRCGLELGRQSGKVVRGVLIRSLYWAQSPGRFIESSRILSTTESRIDSRVCCRFRFFPDSVSSVFHTDVLSFTKLGYGRSLSTWSGIWVHTVHGWPGRGRAQWCQLGQVTWAAQQLSGTLPQPTWNDRRGGMRLLGRLAGYVYGPGWPGGGFQPTGLRDKRKPYILQIFL